MISYRATSGDLAAEFKAAFDAFRAHGAESAVIVLPGEARPRLELVELVAEEIGRTPALVRLLLVHPNPSMGFLASAIGLRAGGRVRVSSAASLDTTAAQRQSSSRPPGRIELVTTRLNDDIASVLRSRLAGLQSRGLAGIAMVFDPEMRPSTHLVDAICGVLENDVDVSILALVHPSPSLGFLASALGLRLPRVRVRAFRATTELVASADLGVTIEAPVA